MSISLKYEHSIVAPIVSTERTVVGYKLGTLTTSGACCVYVEGSTYGEYSVADVPISIWTFSKTLPIATSK